MHHYLSPFFSLDCHNLKKKLNGEQDLNKKQLEEIISEDPEREECRE